MGERNFSLVMGLSLLSILYFDFVPGMYALLGLMVFEGITNWRIPLLISRLRYGVLSTKNNLSTNQRRGIYKINFSAERAARFVYAVIIGTSFLLFNDVLWLIPWFVGFALTVAGLSGVCPLLIFLEKIGFQPDYMPTVQHTPTASH